MFSYRQKYVTDEVDIPQNVMTLSQTPSTRWEMFIEPTSTFFHFPFQK